MGTFIYRYTVGGNGVYNIHVQRSTRQLCIIQTHPGIILDTSLWHRPVYTYIHIYIYIIIVVNDKLFNDINISDCIT